MDGSCENFERRPHLAKHQRLPKCYKEVEKILKDVKACKGNVKTLLNNSRFRGAVFKKVYALTINVLKNRPILDKIIEETELLKKETFLREELAGILVYELVFGKGLPGESHPITVVMKYKDAVDKAYQTAKKDGSLTFKGLPSLPRYARINTLLTTVPDVVKNLRKTGFYQIYYGEEISQDEYLDLVRNLEAGNFLIDYHFKDLLVFAGNENLTTWSLYEKNCVYLQDKSSYIPVFALDPKPGSIVLDACAAPGMKTIHIAASMENKGKIYAYEKDNDRFKILKKMLDSTPIEICEADCEDFYLVNTNDPKFRDLEYILVDPSCSGSGMVNRFDAVTDTKDSKNAIRLQKLAGFQILLLKHALAFPSVKRVVYSTCSITEEENEYVVHEVLAHFNFIFKLVNVMPDWPVRGSDNYKYGNLCLRAYPEKNLTNGFFVAMFERMDYDEQQEVRSLANKEHFLGEDKFSKKRRKGKSKLRQENCKTGLPCNSIGNNIQVSGEEKNSHFLNGDSLTTSDFIPKKKKTKHDTNEAVDFQEVSNYRNSNNFELGTDENHSYKECISVTAENIMEEEDYSGNNSVQRETSNIKIKKKRDKRKHCDETGKVSDIPYSAIETCLPDDEPVTETQDYFDQEELVDIKTKKKKHKRKHCEATSDNFEPITEACPPDYEPTIESHDIFVRQESTDVKTKKKKHKQRHYEETKESSDNLECVAGAHPSSELSTESQDSSSHKKRHKKEKHNTENFGVSDPGVERIQNAETSQMDSKSSSSFANEETADVNDIEEESTTKAKKKNKHARIEKDESMEYCHEDKGDMALDTAETYLKKRHKKKCKNKRTREE